MSRYTVTFEVYIEGDNDKHAYSKAKLIAKNQNTIHGLQDWSVSKLHSTPFAAFMQGREIDIKELQYDFLRVNTDELPF